jgi:hypothetical protein
MKRLIFFNAPVLTAYGDFRFELISIDDAKKLIQKFKDKEILSAIGHGATAEVMSETLDYKIERNRLSITQTVDDTALVFRLKTRADEGKILERKDIEKIGFEFGVLTKVN